jgi:long-chain acyl-CoA synthetase
MLNLATILEESTRRHAAKAAFVFRDTRLSYAQINGAACQVAAALQQMGIQKGDKVAISCLNLPYFPMVYYGILKAGAVVVPLNVLLKRKEIAYHLQDSDAKAYFCFEGTPELPMGEEGYHGFEQTETCQHMVLITGDPKAESPYHRVPTLGQVMAQQSPQFDTIQTMPDDTAVILYTSGTTGHPKGAELTHVNMFLNAQVTADMLQYRSEDITLIVLPLFHSFGQTVLMNGGVLKGMTSVLLPRFDPEAVLGLMQQEHVSVFAGVPTMYWGLLNYPGADNFDLKQIADDLRVCVSGGSSLPVKVLEDFEAKFNAPILEGYGLSESSPVASFNQLGQLRKPGSIGTPVWGIEMCIADENGQVVEPGTLGEILIRGHNIMKGYYQRPEVNAEVLRDGWLHTGDVGKMDEDGYFYIVDRTKDMIIRGGYNVYPREIEEVLMQHSSVSMVAVVGIPHDEHGEEIKAFVVKKAGAEVSEAELLAWGKEQMAAYKYPRLLEFREALPMNATGKILKKELRKVSATA